MILRAFLARGCLFALAVVTPLVAGAPDADEEPWCVLHRLNIRTSKGDPVQFETKEDGSIEATLCANMPNFFVTAEPVEPTFSSGKKCALAGVPGNPVEVELGTQAKVVEIYTYETDPKKPSEKSPLTVKRLDIGLDQGPCAITRTRSASEDCGYAPFLEAARQKAASMPGSGIPMPEAPVNTVTEGSAALLAQKGIYRSDGHIHPNVQDHRNQRPGQNVLRRIRKLQRESQLPPPKKRRSAKWQHLKRRPGMSGLDGC